MPKNPPPDKDKPESAQEMIDRLKEQYPYEHPGNCDCWVCKNPGGL